VLGEEAAGLGLFAMFAGTVNERRSTGCACDDAVSGVEGAVEDAMLDGSGWHVAVEIAGVARRAGEMMGVV
jgi:hypothetical protein